MSRTREEIVDERRRLKAEYRELYDQVAELLFRHDPIGINFETNTDEYEPEVGTILPRLKEAVSPEELCRIIYEEFFRWFNGDELVGPPSKYTDIAKEIWNAYENSNNKRSGEMIPVAEAIRIVREQTRTLAPER